MKQVAKKEQQKSITKEFCVVGVGRSSSFVFICEEKLGEQRDDKQIPNSMVKRNKELSPFLVP